ncbi:MAG: hypothetical protein ACD_60C00079G0005 [uncultured bacterium]|nr:MAG: hypothetical protein ACD_60C00079G0005 [uncultured bacterium]
MPEVDFNSLIITGSGRYSIKNAPLLSIGKKAHFSIH